MHIHEMPKGQRQSRNQGIYRQSPMVPTSSSQYLPHNMARSHSHMNYYATPGDMLQQSQGQQQSTYNVYSQGGPVQPMNYVSLPAPLSTLPIPTLDVPTSLRASSGAWAAHDDHKLMQARAQGLNWAPIQQKFFPNKTANACRKRHERLMEKRNSDEWDSVKLERLGAAYHSMRKEIWQQLAEACGEKWQVVEQKCMSMGVKNLQQQARAAQRRERHLDPSATSPAIPIPQVNTYGNGTSSLGHPLSHSHSTSLSSVHSNSHLPASTSMNNHYTAGASSFNSASGMNMYDDSDLGGEVNEVDQDYEHDNNDESNSDGSRSANSAYGHQTRNSLSMNGYNGLSQNGSSSSIPRSWNEQHMMVGGLGNTRLPSLQDGMGLGRILDQRSGR